MGSEVGNSYHIKNNHLGLEGYRGVCFHKNINKWVANIRVKNTLVYLGSFKTPEEAYTSYLYAKRKHHPFWVEKQ